MLCEVGRIDEAHEQLATEAADGFNYPYDTTWLAAMVNATDAGASLADERACETLLTKLAPFADQVVLPAGILVQGALARSLARAATVLGNYQQAEAWFALAHDTHARLGTPYWGARGQLDHADLYLTRHADGDPERARDLIVAAAATAAEFGCAGLVKRADVLLATI
jgi:hypothetical protein